jgi:ADP-ribose pyrophosphatase YjhB (NUDIX family)
LEARGYDRKTADRTKDPAEDPADCVVREISEETGWKVTAGPLLDCWQYHIREGRDVVVVTYGCHVIGTDPPVVSDEHKRAGLFDPGEVPGLVMPEGYKRSRSRRRRGLRAFERCRLIRAFRIEASQLGELRLAQVAAQGSTRCRSGHGADSPRLTFNPARRG